MINIIKVLFFLTFLLIVINNHKNIVKYITNKYLITNMLALHSYGFLFYLKLFESLKTRLIEMFSILEKL